jgi:hypothetical protein
MGDLKSGETVLVTGNTIFINKNIDIYLYIRHVFEITFIKHAHSQKIRKPNN